MKTLFGMMILALALSLGLSACGRKNPPKPPMSYQPHEEQPGVEPPAGNRPVEDPAQKDPH